jgi:hypothetical protein
MRVASVSKSEHVSVLFEKARSLLYRAAARLLPFPIRKSHLTLQNAQTCQSIFNGLPFGLIAGALRNGLKPLEDCGLGGFHSPSELFWVKL